ncbi:MULTISPECIES: YrzI family small protein [Geobacillus]|uniref:YrzI family protein n=1 Tax=Geobacillus uzenensis TaxID=129339 RepID=A0ABX4DL43_9BACL|nr:MULTISPECIES: YrzI family small protein [Geobacillus]OXB90909.1 YrzI family protein [Geobacillus uzenensis]QIZ68451.1 YrzI family small protein [Geobacillus subterraneus]WPZ17475.1 YrzI family small protein [Geobacillus subterraneus]
MTIHLFFITITIERRKPRKRNIEEERFARAAEEELLDRKCSVHQRVF